MKEYTIVRKIDGIDHTCRIKASSRLQAIETILKQDAQNYPGKRWDSVDVDESVEK